MNRTKQISSFLLICFVFSFLFNSFSFSANFLLKETSKKYHLKELISKVKDEKSNVNFLLEKNESESKYFVFVNIFTLPYSFEYIFKEHSPLKSKIEEYNEKYSLIPLFISFRNIRI